MTALPKRVPGEQAPPAWWATAASEWFDYDDGARARHHEYIPLGVEVSGMEVVATDGTSTIADNHLRVEVLWEFDLDDPADQQACISALLQTAALLARISERGVS